ncbi:MAG: ATP-binding protein [Terriglobia bacterium]
MPECPLCSGTGWKPVEHDGVRRVARCGCVEIQRTEHLLARSRIPPRYEHCAFENFDIRKDRASGQANRFLEAAKLYAQRFVEEYPADFGLLFIGQTGAGKTHLAVAVIRDLMLRKNVPCLFYDFRDLLKEIQDSYNPISQSSELRVLQPVLDAEVLLLDELAALNPSDWVKDTLAFIINSRYNAKKATLITTTLPFGNGFARNEVRGPSGEAVPDTERALNQYGVTLRSRLYEMCKVVEIQSDDYRKAIKQAGWRFHTE